VVVDPLDCYSIALWLVRSAYDAHADRALWLLRASLGHSWWLTESADRPPRGCSPELVAVCSSHEADLVVSRSAGYAAASAAAQRLRDAIERALRTL